MKKDIVWLITIVLFLVACGSEEGGGWYIKFSTPDIPPAPCPIQDLLLDVSTFPGGDWEETGSRTEKAVSVRMGIERLSTSFSGPIGGVFQEIYRFEDVRETNKTYKDLTKSWFTPAESRTEWVIPKEIENLAMTIDQHQVGCNNLKSGSFEQCQYVAQYGPYVNRLFAGMRSLSYDEFIELVKDIDQRAIRCTK